MARCFAPRERREHLDVAQHRERRGEDHVVGRLREAAARVAAVHGHAGVGLLERDHLGAEADARRELGQERARQLVGAAVEVDEVGVEVAELLAQQLEERRVHQRLLVEQEAEHLDRALRPAAQLEELAHAVLVVLGGDARPRVVAAGRRGGSRTARARRSRAAPAPCARAPRSRTRARGIVAELAGGGPAARRSSSRPRGLSIVNGWVASPYRSMSAMREGVRARDAHRPASAHRPGANGSRSVRTRPPTRCCASSTTGS